MRTHQGIGLSLIVHLLTGCGQTLEQESTAEQGEILGTAKQAFSNIGVERLIPLRFIRLLPSASFTLKEAQERTQRANEVFARAGVQYYVASIEEHQATPTITANNRNVVDWAEIQPLAESLGIPPDAYSDGDSAEVVDWLRYFTRDHLGMEQTLIWLTNDGSVSSFPGDPPSIMMAIGSMRGSDRYKFAHEIGHSLGLEHTFQLAPSCKWWDLSYYPQIGGNRYFSSYYDCTDFMSTASGSLLRVDPRSHGSRSIDSSGAVAVLPQEPGGEPVEQHVTGDWELRGFSRWVADVDVPGLNVMTYWDTGGVETTGIISDSQVETIRYSLLGNRSGQRALLGMAGATTPKHQLDFDGDGRRDYAVFEPPLASCESASSCARGTFRVLQSSTEFSALEADVLERTFGILGDVPVPADYDGDGVTDFAVYRNGGGFRDDGTFDPASTVGHFTYCPSSLDHDCSRAVAMRFGGLGHVPLPGLNFDGAKDKGEVATWSPGEGKFFWSPMCKPSGGAGLTWCTRSTRTIVLGNTRSVPVPDLYDGDEKTDVAVYQPDEATFYLRRSEMNWGTPVVRAMGDQFIPATSGSLENRSAAIPIPVYRSYSTPNGNQSRRTFALYEQYTMTFATKWHWWDFAEPIQSCAFSGGDLDDLVVAGVDLNGDLLSDSGIYRTVTGASGRLLLQQASEASCSGPRVTGTLESLNTSRSRVPAVVPDMYGDGKPDLLLLDTTRGHVRALNSAANFRSGLVIDFGGPRSQVL